MSSQQTALMYQGGVNDLALTRLDTQLIAVSGGSDATVKVWSVATSEMLFCFAGELSDTMAALDDQRGQRAIRRVS